MGWCVEWRYEVYGEGSWRTLHKTVIRTADPNYRNGSKGRGRKYPVVVCIRALK